MINEEEKEIEKEIIEPLKTEKLPDIILPKSTKVKLSSLEEDLTFLKITDTTPTDRPIHFIERFVLYVSGGTYRLYVYDFENDVWKYADLNITWGLSTTKTVRNAAGDGTCTLIFTNGLLTGGTC